MLTYMFTGRHGFAAENTYVIPNIILPLQTAPLLLFLKKQVLVTNQESKSSTKNI